ncbi:four helix bundle protein [Candidatus Uhrbacteria bacterium]|nr:four helix bundle protein [Candidatus Uhrbacteria bacterium]
MTQGAGSWELGAGDLKSFTQLEAWQSGHCLVLRVYAVTRAFPSDERFGLVTQLRRCVVSITSNIAEGFGRYAIGEKGQFYSIANGSLTELQNQLLIARDVGYLTTVQYSELAELATITHKLINGLIRSTRSRSQTPIKVSGSKLEVVDRTTNTPAPSSQLPASRPGFTLIELLVTIGLVAIAMGLFGVMAGQLRSLRRDAARGTAQAIADAVLDGALAMPTGALAAQDDGSPRGLLIGEGMWKVVGGRIVLTTLGGDQRGVLPLPGNMRADGTLAFTLTPPTGTDWTVDVLARATDLTHGYVLHLTADRAALLLRNGTETTLGSTALVAPPATVALALAGSTITATVDGRTITATDATSAYGWVAWAMDRSASLAGIAWTESETTTTWDVTGDAETLPTAWDHLAMRSLPNARARLTIADAAAGTPALHALTATVTWTGVTGNETATQSTWATY